MVPVLPAVLHWGAPWHCRPLWLRRFSAEQSEEQPGFHPTGLRVPNQSSINDLIEWRVGDGQTQKILLSGTDRTGSGAGPRGPNWDWLGSTTSRIIKEFTDVPPKVFVLSEFQAWTHHPAAALGSFMFLHQSFPASIDPLYLFKLFHHFKTFDQRFLKLYF